MTDFELLSFTFLKHSSFNNIIDRESSLHQTSCHAYILDVALIEIHPRLFMIILSSIVVLKGQFTEWHIRLVNIEMK